MAKKEVGGLSQQTLIEDAVDDIPKEVLEAVDLYVKAKRKKEKLAESEATLKDAAIALMETHKIERVPIDGGKMLVLKHPGKVDIKKRKLPPDAKAPEDDEDDD